jgi:hypothetical protein
MLLRILSLKALAVKPGDSVASFSEAHERPARAHEAQLTGEVDLREFRVCFGGRDWLRYLVHRYHVGGGPSLSRF